MSTSPTQPTRHWDPPAPGYDPTRHWGTSPTPPGPKPKRRGPILLAAAIGVALLVTTGVVAADSGTIDKGPNPTPPTTPSPGPAGPPGEDSAPSPEFPEQDPEPEPEPAPEPERVEVPTLAGMTRAEAKQILTNLGLEATTKYKSTDQHPAGIVISQSHKAGAWVLPDTTISLVIAKTPPAAPQPPAPSCDPSYPGVCLDPTVEDYDCAGGPGNGPGSVEGPIRVLPPDPFGLDGNDNHGWGCENG